MNAVMSCFNWFFGLGGTVFVPIVMFILALVFKASFSKSLRSALYIGIGLTGLNLIINLAVDAMGPVTKGMVSVLHVNLPVVDIGWGNVGVAWTWPGVLWVLLGIIGVNLILVALKLTKTLWVDMWNIWHGEAVAAIMWAVTGSTLVGVLSGVALLIVNMKLGDLHAKKFQEYNGIPGISIVATSATFTATFAMFVEKILNRIPIIKDLDASPEKIKEKFGVFGEPAVIGVLMGLILGLLARLNVNKTLNLSITLASVLVIMPRMLSLIAEGIIPISNSLAKFMKEKFPGRELYMAVDPAVLLGDPSVMASVILLYPLGILMASFLPGNTFIPIASLAVYPYWVGGIVPYTKGNIIHTVIIALLWTIPVTLVASNLAFVTTHACLLTGLFTKQIGTGALFTNWEESGNLLLWVFVHIAHLLGY